MAPLLLAAAAEAASCAPMRLNDLGHLLQVMGTFLGLSLFSLGAATPCWPSTTTSASSSTAGCGPPSSPTSTPWPRRPPAPAP